MAVTGQLWWAGEGDAADARIAYVNSDDTGQTVEADNDPAPELETGFVQDLGLDTAAGFFFAIVNNGNFGGEARLVRGQIGGSGPATVVADFGVGGEPGDSNFDDIIVNALQVDAINEKIYVSYQDPFGDASNTGIRQFGYDPLTGAVVDEGFLVRADLETNKELDPDNFGLDTLNARDFDLDLSSNTLYFVELFTGGLQEQGLYRMDLTTKVITQMVSSVQFPDEGTNGFIIDVEVDSTTGLVYFSTQSQAPFGSPGYDPAQNGIWVVPEGSTDALATQLVLVGLPLGGNLYAGDMTFDQDQRRLYIESEEDGGTSADDAIYVFQLDALGTTATLVETISPDPAFSSAFANIQGMAFNAIPYLTDVNSSPAAAAEQGAAVDLLTGAPSIADVDGDHLASATVRITGGTFAGSDAGDNLGLGAGFQQSGLVAGTNVTVSWNQSTGTLTLTGYDTLENYEAVLATVRYQASGDNPTNFGANASRTITWTVSDGALGIPDGSRNSATSTVTIAAENDAPAGTVGAPFAVLETDGPTAVTGLAVSDVDADPANDAIEVTLAASLGTIAVATGVPGGITAGQVTGNGTDTVVITATQDAINATFAAAGGVTYDPATDGVDQLTMTTNDLGNTGAGGAQQDVDTVTITVINVNGAPTAPATGSVSTAEDTASSATAIGATDPDNDTLAYSEKPGFEAANGTVSFDQLNGTFTYTPGTDFNGSDSFTILVDDGNGGTAEQVVSVTVTPVNDTPTAPATGSATAAEDGASAATAIGAGDVDGDTLAYSEKPGFGPASGSVSFNQAAGTFTYTPASNFNGSDSFTIVVDDGNGGTTEQVVSMTVTPVNDAPIVAGDGTEEATPIVEDTSPAGQTVSSLFGGQYSDATDQVPGGSSADAFAGIAVTANGSSVATGQWQYYDGAAWVNIGPASDGSAVLVGASTLVRFNPAPNFNGAAPTLSARLADSSGGAIANGATVDLSAVGSTGGITRYSDASVILSQTVIPDNEAPTAVTGTLVTNEDANNGSVVGTVVAQDPDSSTFTYSMVDDAGGRFDISAGGVVTVENGLLLDYEQNASHVIRVQVDDNEGGVSEFDMNVAVNDVHGEFVTGDANGNTFYGGVETDVLFGGHGSDTIRGGGGSDIIFGGAGLFDSADGGDFLYGGAGSDIIYGNGGNDEIYGEGGSDILLGADGNDRLDGGANADAMTGGAGNDIFVLRKGEANGDVILDFNGHGASVGDSIVLQGYAAGTTFTRIGNSDVFRINDHGFIELVTIDTPGPNVHPTDYSFVP